MEVDLTKIKDLTPQTKQTNILAKVVNIGETKEIPSKFGGETRYVTEATVGDDSATIILSLWGDQKDEVAVDDAILIENGYVSLVRGHMRLNIGKYGHLSKSTEEIGTVNTETDMSELEYQQERRSYGGGGRREGGYGGGRGGGSGRGGGYSGGRGNRFRY
jgi:replication factor A1